MIVDYCSDYMIVGCRVLANSRGYCGSENYLTDLFKIKSFGV